MRPESNDDSWFDDAIQDAVAKARASGVRASGYSPRSVKTRPVVPPRAVAELNRERASFFDAMGVLSVTPEEGLRAIARAVRASTDPRAEASAWVTLVTNELFQIIRELDGDEDA